jgi:hypothetical protein
MDSETWNLVFMCVLCEFPNMLLVAKCIVDECLVTFVCMSAGGSHVANMIWHRWYLIICSLIQFGIHDWWTSYLVLELSRT